MCMCVCVCVDLCQIKCSRPGEEHLMGDQSMSVVFFSLEIRQIQGLAKVQSERRGLQYEGSTLGLSSRVLPKWTFRSQESARFCRATLWNFAHRARSS
jgi:hypothetical protein